MLLTNSIRKYGNEHISIHVFVFQSKENRNIELKLIFNFTYYKINIAFKEDDLSMWCNLKHNLEACVISRISLVLYVG